MFRIIEKEGLTKIELICKYKVLSRLFKIIFDTNETKRSDEEQELRNKVVSTFYECYPNFKDLELQEIYSIPVDNGVTQEIRCYNFPELETPGFPYYEELLCINTLCNNILRRELFATMVGQTYFRVGYKNSFYKVIFLEYRYGHEQLFILQNLNNKSDIITYKLDEWSNGRLSGREWCCNYEVSIEWYLENLEKQFQSNKKNLEEILDTIKEGHLCDYNISLETEPGTWLKYKHGEDVYGRLDKKPRVKDIINNVVMLTIEIDSKTYDATSWEILH